MAKLKIKKIFRRILNTVLFAFYIILFVFLAFIVIINLPPVKEKIAQAGIEFLNNQFKTQISVKSVEVDYFGNLVLNETAVKDHHNFDFIKVKEAKAFFSTYSLIKNLLIDKKNSLKINQIRLKEPVVRVITYKGEDRDNFSLFIDKFKSDKQSSDQPFKLEGRADIVNGQFSIVSQNQPKEDQTWLDAKNLNLKVSKVKINGSDINVWVDLFNFKGKRYNDNYIVNQISGLVHYSETELSFKNLILESDTSLLLGSLYFRHTKENGLANFSDQVSWDLDLKTGSKISGKDIRYFVKDWNSNAIMQISSTAKGPLNNLVLTNPIFSSENTFFTAPSLKLKDLVPSESDKSFAINTQGAKLQTSYPSLKNWLPKFISAKIPDILTKFGTANYTGDFSIDKNSIVTKGSLISALGLVKADAKLHDYSTDLPKYEGEVETTGLNLAPFTQSSTIGPITSKVYFDGKGFKLNHMDTKFDGKLEQIEINGKVLHNIAAVGNLKNKVFRGKINTEDSHANFNFEGNLDFSSKTVKTEFLADIKKLDLSYFTTVVDKNTSFKGLVNTNISFSTIDDLIGEINLSQIQVTKDTVTTAYNDIQIKTTSDNGNRNFDVFSPNMITANIYGKYKLNDVPAMLQEGIGNLLVNYKPKKRFVNQEFSFILDIQKDLFDLLMLDVNISPGTTIIGRYIGEGNQLQTQVISQYIYYKNIKLTNPNLFLNTADSLRQFMGSLSSFEIDKNKIDNINFSGFKRNDTLFASTNFYHGKYKGKQTNFDLNLYQTRRGNDMIYGFRPSDIKLNKGKWTLNPDFKPDEAIVKYNVITNKLSLENIVVKSGESEVNLSGEYESKDKFNFDLNLKEVELSKVIPESFLKDMTFEGIATGSAKITKTPQEFKPLVDLDVSGLKFNNQPLGDLIMDASYDASEDKYVLDTKLMNNGVKNFSAEGFIKNETGKPAQVDISLTANKFNVAPIGTFLQAVFSKFRGEATGDVHITGDLTNPQYQGVLAMNNVGFTVNFLGVDYQLTKEQDLQISNGVFYLDNIELMDTVNGSKGTVYGALLTKNFQEWGLNLDFSTEKLLVLNTTMKENDLFYGTVYASGTFSITGSTVSGIEIAAKARALSGSNLTINSSSTTNATDISFIKFLPDQPKEGEETEVKPPLGLTISADVTADSNSVVNLIISQETGDRIQVRGDAKNLKFNMSRAGTITMEGTYTITGDSKYYYNMFVNKDFTIVPGSKIQWENRGPTEANLDITATYTRLVSNIGDYLGISTVPATNVIVKALLTGYLSKPSINFDIDVEGASSIRDQLRSKINNNEGEKYNQVAGIVVFGSFLSDKMGGSSYASSAYDIVLKQLTSVINNISGVFSLDANFNAGSRVENTSDRISIDPTFKLNNRLSIVGSVNMPLEQKSAADVWTYGAKINYDISKNSDKSLVLSGFSKPSTFGLETSLLGNSGANNQAYGAGIVYKRSFNRLSDIIGRKKKDKKNKSDSIQVAPTEGKK
ncbi:hypothetical protein O2K51_03570 [Apibacter raozihei]|uniref:translocation/assembly module TamB domain-containing protein n=1 Tax=Apibacter raozihei TaxID=2500547 RepID=UPI000FE3D547|nr:translocation/assembly module TamB domain-containing protein [Apibacter raozihei]